MNRLTKRTVSLATALMLFNSITVNAVLNMGGQTIFAGTVIEVLEPGPDIQAIIDNITDASAAKPYLIHLGAGVYDLGSTNIVMKPWVSIQGSGQEATKITGAVSTGTDDNTSAVIAGANNTALTDMTIENTGGNILSLAIINSNVSPRLERLTAISTGGTYRNIAVYNIASASPMMKNITAIASGNTNGARAVVNDSSSPTMLNITASASGGTESNRGVFNKVSSTPTMINVNASASGGLKSRGVLNNASSPIMMNITARASGSSESSHGILSTALSSPFIQDSILEGDTKGLRILSDSPGTRSVNNMIINGVKNDAVTGTQCLGNYDENLADVNC